MEENIELIITSKLRHNMPLTREERVMCAYGEIGIFVDEVKHGPRRWTETTTTIFKLDDKLWGIDWECALTELQENEFYTDPYEVEVKEKVITETRKIYVKKENNNGTI